MLKRIIKSIIPFRYYPGISVYVRDRLGLCFQRSYSQEGEDMILSRMFEGRDRGFYVDVGACHPKRFSNTYRFYKRGWRGINIDPTPGGMKRFRKVRPRDINLEVGVSESGEVKTFYLFNDPALNSFDGNRLKGHKNDNYFITGKRNVLTKTLGEILKIYMPPGEKITFLDVDVEGSDLEVLRSNDWNLFRPELILVECLDFGLDEFKESEIWCFLKGLEYEIFAKTLKTVILGDVLMKTRGSVDGI